MDLMHRLGSWRYAFALAIAGAACDSSPPPAKCDPEQQPPSCFYSFVPGRCGDVAVPQICGANGWQCAEGAVPENTCTCGGFLRGNCSMDGGTVTDAQAPADGD